MIHERAIVADDARLADDVSVGAYAIIGPGVEIGAGTRVAEHVVVQGPCRIGARNQIYPFACVGTAPQDKKYNGEPTRLEIGDDNMIREFCTINRGTPGGGGVTRIGSDNWIMAYVHIAHDCTLGSHLVLANNSTLAGHVEIHDWVWFGGFTKVHQFCRVGTHAFCGMNSDLNQDLPPYVSAYGRMAEPRGINSEGLKRRGFATEQIRELREAYRILYRSDLKLAAAIDRLDGLAATQPVLAPLVEFLRTTERGIIR